MPLLSKLARFASSPQGKARIEKTRQQIAARSKPKPR
jgi:hypothetical protein